MAKRLTYTSKSLTFFVKKVKNVKKSYKINLLFMLGRCILVYTKTKKI